MARFGGALSREDAEDIVSDAIIDAGGRCPSDARDQGRAWFMRVVLNRAQDFRRAREGRPRSTRGQQHVAAVPGSIRRFVAWDDESLAGVPEDRSSTIEAALEEQADREYARMIIHHALQRMPADQARLIRRRHLTPDPPTRKQIADELGWSLPKYESAYTAARRALRAAVMDAMMAASSSVDRGNTRG